MGIQREKTYTAFMEIIYVENQNRKHTAIAAQGRGRGLEVLASHPHGKFKASEISLTGSDILRSFRKEDELSVKRLQYCGNGKNHLLSFKEYIKLGRPKKIKVHEKTNILSFL